VLVAAVLLLLVVGCGGGNGEQDGPGSSATYGIAEYAEHSCSEEAIRNWVTTLAGRDGGTWGEAVEMAEAHLEHQESYDGPLSVEFRRGFHEPWLKALGQTVDALRTEDADEPYDEDRLQELVTQPAAFDDASAHLGERFEEACQKVIASWGGGPG
jgi:hypothetical protein